MKSDIRHLASSAKTLYELECVIAIPALQEVRMCFVVACCPVNCWYAAFSSLFFSSILFYCFLLGLLILFIGADAAISIAIVPAVIIVLSGCFGLSYDIVIDIVTDGVYGNIYFYLRNKMHQAL